MSCLNPPVRDAARQLASGLGLEVFPLPSLDPDLRAVVRTSRGRWGHAAAGCSPPFPNAQALRKVEQAWRYDGPERSVSGSSAGAGDASPAADSRIWKVRELLETDLPQPHWLVPPIVVIDILSRFWPERAKNDGHNAYHWESAVMGEMKDLAERRGIALVLVHHTNRSTPADPLDKVSGTNAMTGVPGAILVLGRERASTDGKLYVTGRSVEEQTIEMTFNPHLRGWCAKDPLAAGGLGMPL